MGRWRAVPVLALAAAGMLLFTAFLKLSRPAPGLASLFVVPDDALARPEAAALARASRNGVDLVSRPAATVARDRMDELMELFRHWKVAAEREAPGGDARWLNANLNFHFLMPIFADRNLERPLGVFLHCPRTFSPALFDQNVAVPLPAVHMMRKRSFLELGTGSGYISVLAARSGAAPVVALDVNADAVQCARRNAQMAGVNVECLVSDLFAAVPARRFDTIFFNIPWAADAMPAGAPHWERALTGGRALLQRLLREAKEHLTYRGAVFLVIFLAESPGRVEMWEGEFATLVHRHGWTSRVLSSTHSADAVHGDGHLALVRLQVQSPT